MELNTGEIGFVNNFQKLKIYSDVSVEKKVKNEKSKLNNFKLRVTNMERCRQKINHTNQTTDNSDLDEHT